MTNKEAVARIKDHKAVHKMDEPRAIYISEALDIAIEALEENEKLKQEIEAVKQELATFKALC